MALDMDPTFGSWLFHPLDEEFFSAVAADPQDFATTWTWNTDIATFLMPASIRAPLCNAYPAACVTYKMHHDFLLVTLTVQARRKFEQYERNAQAATFLDPSVYMGPADRSQLADLWWSRHPSPMNWRTTMSLALQLTASSIVSAIHSTTQPYSRLHRTLDRLVPYRQATRGWYIIQIIYTPHTRRDAIQQYTGTSGPFLQASPWGTEKNRVTNYIIFCLYRYFKLASSKEVA